MAKTCKYQKLQRYVSYDNGATWQAMDEYQRGELIQYESQDCGGSVVDRWIDGWLCDDCTISKYLNVSSSATYSAECDASSAITTSDITHRTEISGSSIGSCVTTIGNGAYSGCTNLYRVNIPNTVTSIGNGVFSGCTSLMECGIPDSVKTIGNNAFNGCIQMAYINLPNDLESLGEYAFANCHNFYNINIPPTLTSIPAHCFDNCDGLSDIEVQSSIQTIGNSAFANCNGLYYFTIYAMTPPTLGSNVFYNVNANFKIFVPSEVVNTYKSAAGWSNYSSKIFAI